MTKYSEKTQVVVVQMPVGFDYKYNPEKEIAAALKELQMIEDADKKVLLIGHSWGGHAVQNFIHKHQDLVYNGWKVIGGVLLGSSIHRDLIKINDIGASVIDLPKDANILVIGGDFDGLNRVTRLAETFWHTNQMPFEYMLIETVLIKGMNHAQFADDQPSKNPDYIKSHDLKAQGSQDDNQ